MEDPDDFPQVRAMCDRARDQVVAAIRQKMPGWGSRRGPSNEDVAKALGLSKFTVNLLNHWAAPKYRDRVFSLGTLYRLHLFTGLTFDELLLGGRPGRGPGDLVRRYEEILKRQGAMIESLLADNAHRRRDSGLAKATAKLQSYTRRKGA